MCSEQTTNNFTIITLSMGLTQDLKATLKSVNIQDRPVRHILIDGSESEKTRMYCQRYFPAVEFYSQKPDGIYAAMNFGLEMIPGHSWVLFLNEGDFLLGRNAISNLIGNSPSPDYWCFGSTVAFELDTDRREIYGDESFNYKAFRKGKVLIPHPSTAIPARWIKELHGFNPKFRIGADLDLIYRIFSSFGPPRYASHLVTAHQLGGISSTSPFLSKLESLMIRIRNYPLDTIFAFTEKVTKLIRQTGKTLLDGTQAGNVSVHHVDKCKKKNSFPVCCRNKLLGYD